ncbi:hypothetical protein ACFE04_011022 [Oxalis oulophora]
MMDSTNLNNSSNEQLNLEPYIGMQFDSLDDITQFYKEFSRRKGFGVRIRSTKNNFRSMVCSNEGYHKIKNTEKEEGGNNVGENNEGGVKKKCSTARMGCTALLITSKGKNDEKWILRVLLKNLTRRDYQLAKLLLCLIPVNRPSRIEIVGINIETHVNAI